MLKKKKTETVWECKGDCSNRFCFIVKTSTGEWEHILPVVDR